MADRASVSRFIDLMQRTAKRVSEINRGKTGVTACPVCESTRICVNALDHYDYGIIRKRVCSTCATSWTEYFKFDKIDGEIDYGTYAAKGDDT